MIDINIAFFYQLINFAVLLVALNVILFKPLRAIMREREEGIGGAFSDSKAAQDRAQILLEQYTVSLAEAKQKAAAAYNTFYQQGLLSAWPRQAKQCIVQEGSVPRPSRKQPRHTIPSISRGWTPSAT